MVVYSNETNACLAPLVQIGYPCLQDEELKTMMKSLGLSIFPPNMHIEIDCSFNTKFTIHHDPSNA